MHEFTFKIEAKNLAQGTLLVSYYPSSSNLSPHLTNIGVPLDLLVGTPENVAANLRSLIIKASPQGLWDNEAALIALDLDPTLDDYIGRDDLPPVTQQEINSVLTPTETP